MSEIETLRARLHDLAVAYQRARDSFEDPTSITGFATLEAAHRPLKDLLDELAYDPAALVEIFAPGGDGWLPIESAPKDGEVLQLWTGHYQHTGIYLESTQAWHALADDVELVPVPVLWRPLPAPPALQENPDAR